MVNVLEHVLVRELHMAVQVLQPGRLTKADELVVDEAILDSSLAYSTVVSCRPPSHYVSHTHCRSPAVPHARALACMSVMVEGVKGAKFFHEVH